MKSANHGSGGGSPVERYFYFIATLLLLVLTVVGFRLFYFHGLAYPGRPLVAPVRTLVISHGVAMSLWMLLALAQPLLVAVGKRRLHMAVGRFAAVIALGLTVLGMKVGIEACKASPPDLMYGPLTPKQFMAVPVMDILLFAMFVVAGVLWRKRPERHKPMMLLASLAAVGAAIARIDPLNHLYAGTIWERMFGVFFFTVVIGIVLLVAKCAVFRKFDRWFAAGVGMMLIWFLVATQIATTPVWDAIARFLLRL